MTEAMTGIFILLMISVIAAFFAFALIPRNFVLACVAAAAAAMVLFQVADYLNVGYLDSFFPFVMVVTFFMAYGIAAAVGLMIRMHQ